jgi:hypothetical protein
MKKHNFKKFISVILIFISISLFAQIEISDKSEKPKTKANPYDGSFMDFSDMMLEKEDKAGVVGQNITLIDVYSVKNQDGSRLSFTEDDKFENKTFVVIGYTYDYKDILKIENESGIYIFEPKIIDSYVFNGYIEAIKEKLENKFFIPLKLETEIKSLEGDEISIDGTKEYKISKVSFSKIPSGHGIVVQLNEEFEVIYPNSTFGQRKEKGWINLESANLLKNKITFIEKNVFLEFSISNKLYLDNIRNGKVKIGMTEKQCRFSWGLPDNSMSNISGYDTILIYGTTGNSNNLYFKNGILKLIK